MEEVAGGACSVDLVRWDINEDDGVYGVSCLYVASILQPDSWAIREIMCSTR